jgi:LPS O-antigen subunit length determinant protein (WzzB/FepE family)
MNRIHPIRRLAGILAGLAGGLLAFTAASPAAFAERVPPPGGGGTVQAPPQVYTIVTGGMPGWQIVLIAVAAAVIAATVAVILDRVWAARRHLAAPTA